MRTTVNACTVLALLVVSFWAPHAAFVPVEVRGPGFMNKITTPAVTSDVVPADPDAWLKHIKESGDQNQKVIGEVAPGKFRMVQAEKTRIEPTKADRYICSLGHMLQRGPRPHESEPVLIQGVGPVEVKVDTNRLLIEYALIVAVCALFHQLIALIPTDPEEPPRPSPWPDAARAAVPATAPVTEPAQPPAQG